jgi:hypothetical protein
MRQDPKGISRSRVVASAMVALSKFFISSVLSIMIFFL